MKLFKTADLILQLTLLLTAPVYMAVTRDYSAAFCIFYFGLGGWQLSSYFIHLACRRECRYREKDRRLYGKTIAWTFSGAALFLLLAFAQIPLLLFYLGAAIFITPVFACWYLYICYREWRALRMRELVHLKN